MKTKSLDTTPSTAAVRERVPTDFVTSTDGTKIGYRQVGHGPGVVLVHGSMSTCAHHTELAAALADAFTVYVPDRRGFGLSGPCGTDDGVGEDVEDLGALLAKTGAHNVVGISVGGIICLRAALSLPAIHKAAIYEPPLFANRATPAALVTRVDRELAHGKVADALTTAMQGARLGPAVMNAMPHWLLAFMTRRMLAWQAKRGPGAYASFGELAPTLRHDGRVIAEMSGEQERLRGICATVLLLGGSKSSAFLKGALDGVERVVPQVSRVELPGLDHAASWNSDLRGKPGRVAQALRPFFA